MLFLRIHNRVFLMVKSSFLKWLFLVGNIFSASAIVSTFNICCEFLLDWLLNSRLSLRGRWEDTNLFSSPIYEEIGGGLSVMWYSVEVGGLVENISLRRNLMIRIWCWRYFMMLKRFSKWSLSVFSLCSKKTRIALGIEVYELSIK